MLARRALYMSLISLTLAAFASGCAPQHDITEDDDTLGTTEEALSIAAHREHVSGDLFHTTFDVRIGVSANAVLRIHRVTRELAPGVPRPSKHAVMMLHGDFATFVTNFLPTAGDPASTVSGLAKYLASRDVDVWGLDRRWTLPGQDGDTSDFAAMGVVQELDDLDRAITFARATRLATGSGGDKIALAGFSHGGELAYAFAARDGGRPKKLRQISALAPLDVYYDIAPADADLRAYACANAAAESDSLAQGVVDVPNDFFISLGQLDRSAPLDTSPLFGPPFTNRDAMYYTAGLTHQFAPYTPLYHLLAPVLDGDGNVASLRFTGEDAASAWFAGAPPHQSLREGAELDAIWCGTPPSGADAPLSNITVPVFYLGAAGAFGDHGLFTTTQLGTSDVTTVVVHKLGAEALAEDFGHGDLLFAADAKQAAWSPLAAWLIAH
ncbi:putative lipoprotein [Minicystis rosea]|nr:putative lipoprotein [Minicystis rosea]